MAVTANNTVGRIWMIGVRADTTDFSNIMTVKLFSIFIVCRYINCI